jgi:phenylacetate-CoA ligase
MNLDKWKIVRSIFDIKREQWFEPEKLLELQQSRLEGIIRSAYLTGHYRPVLDARSLTPKTAVSGFGSLPFTGKADISAAPSGFISSDSGKELSKFTTSGSSGRPLPIFMDKDALYYSGAMKYARLTDFGLSPLDLLAEVNVWTQTPRLERMGIFRRLRLPVLDSEAANLAQVARHGANVISSYPTVMATMARLNNECQRPMRMKAFLCGGEILTAGMRKLAESSFSCDVFQTYGNMEFGFVAWECPQEHNMHVCSSSILMEIVDDNGRPKKSGTGEVVITTLYNHAMPLLRYKIGDLASWGSPCACGRGWPVLKSIEGRSGQDIILPSGKSRPSFAFNVLYDLKSDASKIAQFQIVQKSPGLFVFRFVPANGGPDRACIKEIEERIHRACLYEEIKVEFEEADRIPRSLSGKLSHIIPTRNG